MRRTPLSQGYAFEHRMVVHDAGITLAADHHVHHRNHDPADNRLENLEVLTAKEHARVHGDERRLYDPKRAADLYLTGLSTTNVARVLGTHAGNVSRMLAEVGVKARPGPGGRPDLDWTLILSCVGKGEPVARVAKRFGTSRTLVKRTADQRGIKTRGPGRPADTFGASA